MSKQLDFFMKMAKAQSTLTRRFDGSLAGLGLTEFIVMFHLSQSAEGRVRPMDLAEKAGLTPSGITRLLRPMEKVGYIRREAAERDARVSYVVLGAGGKVKLEQALENAEILAEDLLTGEKPAEIAKLSEVLHRLAY